jgi:hypothetical protein
VILTLYRSRRSIFVVDPSSGASGVKARRLIEWDTWGFAPLARAAFPGRAPGVFHGCAESIAVAVVTPHFAKIVDRQSGPRLAFHGEPDGVDAETAAVLAFARQRGFKLAAESR